jgi:hypothetical protein
VSVVAATLALNRRAITAPGDDGVWGQSGGRYACLLQAMAGEALLPDDRIQDLLLRANVLRIGARSDARLWTSTLRPLALPTAGRLMLASHHAVLIWRSARPFVPGFPLPHRQPIDDVPAGAARAECGTGAALAHLRCARTDQRGGTHDRTAERAAGSGSCTGRACPTIRLPISWRARSMRSRTRSNAWETIRPANVAPVGPGKFVALSTSRRLASPPAAGHQSGLGNGRVRPWMASTTRSRTRGCVISGVAVTHKEGGRERAYGRASLLAC